MYSKTKLANGKEGDAVVTFALKFLLYGSWGTRFFVYILWYPSF